MHVHVDRGNRRMSWTKTLSPCPNIKLQSLFMMSYTSTTVLCYMDRWAESGGSSVRVAIINASPIMVSGKPNSMGIKLTFTKCKSFVLTQKILSEQSLFSLKPTPLSWVLLSIICINAVWFVPSQALPLTLRSRPWILLFFLEVRQARIWSQKFNWRSIKTFLVSDDFKVGNASFALSVNLGLFCGASVATEQSQRDFGQVTFLARERWPKSFGNYF